MSWYLVVEGRRTESKVYPAWISAVFPGRQRVERPEDLGPERYFMIAGNGYPQYLTRIRAAVADIRAGVAVADHLLVCVDTEEVSLAERVTEIAAIIEGEGCPVDSFVAVADCCMETWFLGNVAVVRQAAQTEPLQRCQQHYDVRTLDPERMDFPEDHPGSRAAYHLKYLRAAFAERGMTYAKESARHVTEATYLRALVKRCETTGHLGSFGRLVRHWRAQGGSI